MATIDAVIWARLARFSLATGGPANIVLAASHVAAYSIAIIKIYDYLGIEIVDAVGERMRCHLSSLSVTT